MTLDELYEIQSALIRSKDQVSKALEIVQRDINLKLMDPRLNEQANATRKLDRFPSSRKF